MVHNPLFIRFIVGEIGAVASGVGSVIQGLSNIGANKRQMNYQTQLAKQQQQYNLELMENQAKYNLEAFDYEAAYNDPSAQRARLEAANLNPALLYSGSGVQGTTGAQGVSGQSAPSVDGSYIDPIQGVGQALQGASVSAVGIQKTMAEIDAIRSQADRTRGETELQSYTREYLINQTNLLGSQALTEDVRRSVMDVDLSILNDTKELTVESARMSVVSQKTALDHLGQEIVRLKNENSLFGETERQMRLATEQMATNLILSEVRIRSMKLGMDLTSAQILQCYRQMELMSSQIDVNQTQQYLNEARTQTEGKRPDNVEAMTSLLNFRANLAELDKKWYIPDKLHDYYQKQVDNLIRFLPSLIPLL